MLTNITLKNVKCFDDLDINLSNLTILTGINGAGKSTIIQSVLLAEQSANHASLNLNGPLAEIGSYSDLFHRSAEDNGAHIAIRVGTDFYRWGYDNDVKDKNSIFELPRLDGTSFSGFDDFLYISAERWGPRNNVPLNMNSQNKNWLGKHGEYTIPVLGALRSRERSGTKDKEDILAKDDPRHHESKNSSLIYNNIVKWMGEVSPNVSIEVEVVPHAVTAFTSFGFGDGGKYKATNVGFGLSYALGIVTSLLISKAGSFVVIENPEAHLHPRGQSKLGELIALAANAGVQVLVETHSDHIVNAIRVSVKEKILRTENVNLLYFSRSRSGDDLLSNVTPIEIDKDGEILNWPEGFLDEWNINLGKLLA